jgi:hypothetical protein
LFQHVLKSKDRHHEEDCPEKPEKKVVDIMNALPFQDSMSEAQTAFEPFDLRD